jgi:hypothetical protein
MSNYNSTVQYFRVNANNTAIATTNNGVGSNSPSEEITAPVLGGTYVSGGSTANIVGAASGTQDFNDLALNQYLYYIDGTTGAYVLMGQIQAIGSATALTLYANSLAVPTASASLVGSYFLITNTESIYFRIATEIGGNAGVNRVNLPDFSFWRTSSNVTTGVNNPGITKLEQISNVGFPVSTAASVQNIDFTIQTMNVFTAGSGANSSNYFPSTAAFPTYIWIKITPATTNNNLASKTMYRLTTEESFPRLSLSSGLAIGINTPLSVLQTGGYNITQTSTQSNQTGGN